MRFSQDRKVWCIPCGQVHFDNCMKQSGCGCKEGEDITLHLKEHDEVAYEKNDVYRFSVD